MWPGKIPISKYGIVHSVKNLVCVRNVKNRVILNISFIGKYTDVDGLLMDVCDILDDEKRTNSMLFDFQN